MLDIKLIRENKKIVEENLKKRGEDNKLLKEVIDKDKKWRELIKKNDKLKQDRNNVSKKIAELKKAGKDAKKEMIKAKSIPDEIKKNKNQADELQERIKYILMRLPNILHESVPVGEGDEDNVEIKKHGKIPKFTFEQKGHLEILENLGLIDLERGAKIAGHGFFYLKGELALLDYALMRFTIDFLMKKGYTLIEPPYMMKREAYEGVTDVADFENVMYKIDGEDLYLIATSEHPMGAMFMNETLDKKDLPIKFVGISPCFRKEVGAHGKYTKGLFRMHNFNKIEQFIFCLQKDSWKYHEELQKNSEELYQTLEVPYRVVNVCTGDIGSIAAKKYDIEAYMAGDGKYREVGSNSNCTDYQARRLNIKYRDKAGAPPKDFVHTLNNTAIATSRTLIAIIEANQQKDGSIKIPKVLVPYMNGKKIIKA